MIDQFWGLNCQTTDPATTGDRWHLVRTCNWRWWEGGLLQPALVKFFLLVLLLKVLISVLSIYSETNQPLRTSTSETFKRAWERDNFLCRPAAVPFTISLTLLGGKLYILVFIWKIKSFHFIKLCQTKFLSIFSFDLKLHLFCNKRKVWMDYFQI